MPNDWFRLPDRTNPDPVDEGTPNFFGHEVDGWSGNTKHPNGPPLWVVRVYADENTLNSLENEPGVVRLDNVPTQALNNMMGVNKNSSDWEESMRIEE